MTRRVAIARAVPEGMHVVQVSERVAAEAVKHGWHYTTRARWRRAQAKGDPAYGAGLGR